MTAYGLCEVCGKETGFYTYDEPQGWYCAQHRKAAPPKIEVKIPPKKKAWWQK
jgi:hypothetical protein